MTPAVIHLQSSLEIPPQVFQPQLVPCLGDLKSSNYELLSSMMELGNILQRFHTFTQLSDRMTQCFFHSLTHVTSQMIINVSTTLKTTSSSHWRLILHTVLILTRS